MSTLLQTSITETELDLDDISSFGNLGSRLNDNSFLDLVPGKPWSHSISAGWGGHHGCSSVFKQGTATGLTIAHPSAIEAVVRTPVASGWRGRCLHLDR